VFLHWHGCRIIVSLVGDRAKRVFAVEEGMTGVALGRGLDELERGVRRH
jgi:hypothetical protein